MEFISFLGLTLLLISVKRCEASFKPVSYTILSSIPSGAYINNVGLNGGSCDVYYEITKISYSKNRKSVQIGNKTAYANCQGVPFCLNSRQGIVTTTNEFSPLPGQLFDVMINPLSAPTISVSICGGERFTITSSCPYNHLYPFFKREEFSKCLKKQYALTSVKTFSKNGITFYGSSSMYMFSYLEIDMNLIPSFAAKTGTFIATVTSGNQNILDNWDAEKNTTTGRLFKIENFMFYKNMSDQSKVTIPLDWPVFDVWPKFVDVNLQYYQICWPVKKKLPTSTTSLDYKGEYIKKFIDLKSMKVVVTQPVPLNYDAVKLIGISMKSVCDDKSCVESYQKEYKRNNSMLSENCKCCIPMAGLYERCKDIETLGPLSLKPAALAVKMHNRPMVTLTCSYPANRLVSNAKIGWLKDGKKADFGKFPETYNAVKEKQRLSSVVFEVTKAEQQGYYSCHAENIYRFAVSSRKTLLLLPDVSYMKFTYHIETTETAGREYKSLKDDLVKVVNQTFYEHGINSKRVFEAKKARRTYEIYVASLDMRISDRQSLCNKLGNIQSSLEQKSSLKMISFDCCRTLDGNGPNSLVNSTITTNERLNNTFNQTVIRRCVWNNTHGAQWSTENVTLVRALYTLEELSKMQITESNSLEISQKLVDATKRSQHTNDESDLKLIVDVIERMVTIENHTETKVAENILKTTSNIMDYDRSVVAKSQERYKTSDSVIKILQKVADNVELKNSSLKIEEKNIAVLVLEVKKTKISSGIFIEAFNDTNGNSRIKNEFSSNALPTGQKQASVFLSLSTLKIAAVLTNSTHLRVTSCLFQNSKLFLPPPTTEALDLLKNSNNQDYKNGRKDGRYSVVNSKVISASLKGVKLQNLGKVDEIFINFLQVKNSTKFNNQSCVFWNFTAADCQGNWSNEGCFSIGMINGYHRCRCNHLTNFALLLDVTQSHRYLSNIEKKSLSIFTYIGCGISLVCLFITFITFAAFRKLRKNKPTQILVFLCLSLMLMMAALLIGSRVSNRPTCLAFGILTHYFLLSSFCWMAVEGFNLCLCLVKIMKSNMSKFMLKCNLFAWGLPAVIVAITAGVTKLHSYGRQQDGKWICVLYGFPFYFASLLPMLLIMAINLVILVLVLRSLGRKSTVSKSNELSNLTKVRIAIGCALLMGVTWTVGLFAIGRLTYVVQLVFCALNSLQGLFIFVMYCARHKDVRQEWKKFLGADVSSSTTMSNKQSKRSTQKSSESKRTTLKSKSSNQKQRESEEVKKGHDDDEKPLMSKRYDGAMLINYKKVNATLPGDEAEAVLLRYQERSSFKH